MKQFENRVRQSRNIEDFDTLLCFLELWAQKTPDKLVVETQENGKLSYRQLLDNAYDLAAALVNQGLRAGDRIAIQLPSGPEFVTAYFATGIMGGVLTTLHMPYRQEELLPLVRFSGARAIICAEVGNYDAPATMKQLRESIDSLEHIIVVSGPTPQDCLSFQTMIETADRSCLASESVASESLATLCFTSGTSAAPKGILRNQRVMVENAIRFSRMIDMTADDRVMIATPLTHVFGLLCAGNAIVSGATILLIPLFSPDVYAQMLTGMSPTIVYSAPAHLAATLKSGALEGNPPQSVRDVIVGGSICAPNVAAAFEDKLPNGRVGCLFGMTETLLITQTDPSDPAEIRHGTVGKLAEGLQVRIVKPDGTAVDPKTEGEMQLSGYSIISEYHNNPNANASSFTDDGWFRTGDLAIIDERGNIIITGRIKDIINRGGIKINPSDLESLLDSHDSIIQSAVVPMPDEVLGERICLYVTLKPGENLTLELVCNFLESNNFAKMRWPERLEIVNEMPMTPTKKIIKAILTADIRQKLSYLTTRS